MHEVINFLGDIPGPFPIYDPDPATNANLITYIIIGLVVIAGLTGLVLLMIRPGKKKK